MHSGLVCSLHTGNMMGMNRRGHVPWKTANKGILKAFFSVDMGRYFGQQAEKLTVPAAIFVMSMNGFHSLLFQNSGILLNRTMIFHTFCGVKMLFTAAGGNALKRNGIIAKRIDSENADKYS